MNWDAEIRRKAQSGIALTNPNDKSQALYNQHQQKTIGEIKRKAQEGVTLTNPNDWANSIYNQNKPTEPKVNPNDMINDLYNNQRNATLAQLKASRDKATGQLNQQRAELAPQYQGMRNQSDVAAQQGAQRLREIMAANGLSASGENVSASASLQSQRQNSLNSLNLQEQQQNNDISRRIADLNNPAEENALIAALEAERARAMLGQFNTDRQFGLQEGGLLGNYNGQRTLQGQQFDSNNLWRGKEFDYRQERDQVGDNQYQEQFEYKQARDQIADERYKLEFDEDVRRFGLNYAVSKQRARSGGSSGGGANTSGGTSFSSLSTLDQGRIADMWKNGTEEVRNHIAKTYPDVFQNAKSNGISEWDGLQLNNQISSMGINLNNATDAELKNAIAGLRSTYGWSDQDANNAYSFLKSQQSVVRSQPKEPSFLDKIGSWLSGGDNYKYNDPRGNTTSGMLK